MPIVIRQERSDDADAIRELNARAFGQEQEGRLIDALRANGGVRLSLVAMLGDRLVGHVMYSPIVAGAVTGAALGPMAVHPDLQRQGIGTALITSGTPRLRATGCPFIVVLGHADYYPRFGFTPASAEGLQCQWDVPDEVFMILVLDRAKMKGVSGLANYRQEFSIVT